MATPYMDHDLCGLLDNPKVEFTIPQIKCYARQLLEGTAYLHRMNILHRDMKAANLLISNQGILQIADFGLARSYLDDPNEPKERRREYTSMVVTRWYRPPELLLGERRYTPAIDLWGVGCILAEMYKGKPILQGPNDIAQLDMVFQLCGTPTEVTWPGWMLLPGCEGVRSFKTWPRTLEREYERHGEECVDLLGHLMRLDPSKRYTATEALTHKYFTTDPLPASPSDLPTYEASHELDKSKYHASRAEARALAPKAPAAAGEMSHQTNRLQRDDDWRQQKRRSPRPADRRYDRRDDRPYDRRDDRPREIRDNRPREPRDDRVYDKGDRRDDIPREPRSDRPREPRDDRPRDSRYDRPRESRDDRPRDSKDDRPRDSKDDRPRDSRDDRPREPRDDRSREPRADRSGERRDDRPNDKSDDRPREHRDPPRDLRDDRPRDRRDDPTDRVLHSRDRSSDITRHESPSSTTGYDRSRRDRSPAWHRRDDRRYRPRSPSPRRYDDRRDRDRDRRLRDSYRP